MEKSGQDLTRFFSNLDPIVSKCELDDLDDRIDPVVARQKRWHVREHQHLGRKIFDTLKLSLQKYSTHFETTLYK